MGPVMNNILCEYCFSLKGNGSGRGSFFRNSIPPLNLRGGVINRSAADTVVCKVGTPRVFSVNVTPKDRVVTQKRLGIIQDFACSQGGANLRTPPDHKPQEKATNTPSPPVTDINSCPHPFNFPGEGRCSLFSAANAPDRTFGSG